MEMADVEKCTAPCDKIVLVDATVTELAQTIGVFIATTDLRVKRVEDGVSNYIRFMARADEFFTAHKTREDDQIKFHNTRDQEIKDTLIKRNNMTLIALGILSLFIGLLGGALAIPPAVVAVKDLLKSDVHWPKIFTVKQIDTARNSNRPALAGETRDRPWQ